MTMVVIHFVFCSLRKQRDNGFHSLVFNESGDIGSSYIPKDKIISFPWHVDISSLNDEEMVILEACFPIEKVNMLVSPYF